MPLLPRMLILFLEEEEEEEDSSFMAGCRNTSCERVENESECAGAVMVLLLLEETLSSMIDTTLSSSTSPLEVEEAAWVEKDEGEVVDDADADDDDDDDDDDAVMDVGL